MKFDAFLTMIRQQAYFDLATLVQLSGEDRATLRTQLSRWIRAGRLMPLRRGMYALATRYRAAAINPAELANQIYRPSYLSGQSFSERNICVEYCVKVHTYGNKSFN